MNIYSVLDSDEDEKPTKQATKKVAAPAPAPANATNGAKPAKDAKTEPKGNTKPKAPVGEFESPPQREKGPKQHMRHGAKNHHAVEVEGEAPRKRQFDRRSATGRGREVSKDGAGGANWGNDKLEALKAEKHIAGDSVDVAEVVTEENAANATAAAPEVPAEPEVPVFTLDQYNKKREEARANNEAFAEVKLREVTDDFAGMKSTSSDANTVFIALGAQKQQKSKKDQRSANKSAVLDVAFTIAPTEQPRNDRDNRGGNRGPRNNEGGRGAARGGDRGSGDRPKSGRGGDRGRGDGPRSGSAKNGPRVDFTDATAFPSL